MCLLRNQSGHRFRLVQDIANRNDAQRQVEAKKEQQHAEFTEAVQKYGQTFRLLNAPGDVPDSVTATSNRPDVWPRLNNIFPTFLQKCAELHELLQRRGVHAVHRRDDSVRPARVHRRRR